ncbi:MAG: dTMP kinase [Nitriliruptoraceae bacterium]
MALRGDSVSASLALLGNRGFRNLALSTLVSTLGDWIGFLAIIALTADILGPTRAAAFAVSGVMAARVLPSLVLGPIAGVFVDRWDRKRVMMVAHLGRGTVMALIPFTNEILALLLATLVIEVMSSLFGPAKDAMLPSLVRPGELVVANQINLVTTYGTLPLGGALYAVLVAYAGQVGALGGFLAERPVALAIWFNAVSFFVAALVVTRIPRLTGRRRTLTDLSAAPGAWEQLKEGFRFIAGHRVIRAMVVGVMVAFAAAGVVITAGEFFASQLNAGPSGYGILVAVVGSGMVAGLVAAAPLTARLGPERLFSPGIGLAGLALMVTAAMPSLGWVIAPAFVMGAGAGISFIVGYTVLQQRSDDRLRGRTFGAFNSGVRASIFGSTILVPTMIGVLGRERRLLTTLEDGTQALLYPYTFGGVRITLLVAGMFAVLGALATARTLHAAVKAEHDPATLDLFPLTDDTPVRRKGQFIVFEGGDGAGKSTQIRLLRGAIERAGHDVVVTREPGGTALGERVRELLLDPVAEISPQTEALLYAAARAQHIDEVILPALEKGWVVLCDRYVDSSIVYQGTGRGLGDDQVAELNRWATQGAAPDLTVLMDIDPRVGLQRAADAGALDRLESAGTDFHRLVRESYLRLAGADPERYLVVDASATVEALHQEISSAVLAKLSPQDEI